MTDAHTSFLKLLGIIIVVVLLAWAADQNDELGMVIVALVAGSAIVWFAFNYDEFNAFASKLGFGAQQSSTAPVIRSPIGSH